MANELYGGGMAEDDGDDADVDEDSMKTSLGKRLCKAIKAEDYAAIAEAVSRLSEMGSE